MIENKDNSITHHTDCYFSKSREAAAYINSNPRVVYQLFQKTDAIMAGVGLVMPMLLDRADEVWSLQDGDAIAPFEPAMHIIGQFDKLVELESVYLGILARCTKVATNVRKAVVAAKGKPVLFFPARFDVPEAQFYDGYAAAVGGASGCATPMQTDGFNHFRRLTGGCYVAPVGTMPHALIAACNGDTVEAALAFAYSRPKEDCWVLVDFDNDSARTAVAVFQAFEQRNLKLEGIRLDTSEKLADKGILSEAAAWGVEAPKGVCPQLVQHVRRELDKAGATGVRIAVSGGFTPEKIVLFENLAVPTNVYAVGEGFLKGSTAFTSDIVARYDGTKLVPCGKVGRELKPSNRLVEYPKAKATVESYG